MANGIGENISRSFSFWGMVGAVMLALKLKERMDDYQEIATEEGRVALPRTPHEDSEEAALFRDGDDDVTLHEVDTTLGARPKRKRSKDCCVCCGLRCGLFWKAFGIVCLIVLAWQTIRLIIWAVTPTPNGLENMPVYSSSLGCLDADFLYQGDKNTYVVPIDPSRLDHSIDFSGAAVGTLVIAEATHDAENVRFEMTLRTNDKALLSDVSVVHPSHEDIEEGLSHSRIKLNTPNVLGSACMRFDTTLYIPPKIKKLHVQAHSVAHISFDAQSKLNLDKLFITMYNNDKKNMLLPNPSVVAGEMTLEMTRGWLVGEVNLVNETVISTQRGDATTNLRVLPLSLDDPPTPATLQTTTGAGRTDLFYVSDHGSPHRPISAIHRSSRNGDLYLTYKDAEFSGTVKLDAKSYTTTGLQGSPHGSNQDIEPPWHGDKNGKDRLTIQSLNGWVGLYFQ
ncbi:hypothetical protein NLI96_g1480 [Meripilus lineatus]|uniref:Uncharacterized protein n=1 Tax=Meripilus lineatus TaxID=2056292 RepID=A0AAD5YMS9_9APHY|nr:hypothetical protein NLI96_g1480 [Physisporinus lineatus]